MRRVLVSLEHHDGRRAGIVDDEDSDLLLTGDVSRGGGTVLDGEEPGVEGWDDATIAGGRLPGGARTAQVRGAAQVAAGDGAWVAVTPGGAQGPHPAVCFRDAKGALVAARRPLRALTRAVDDATDGCPACGERAWRARRASSEVICWACGQSVGGGTFFYGPGRASQWRRSRVPADFEAQHAREQAERVAQASFPIYGPPGASAADVRGWGESPESGTHSVVVGEAPLIVTSEAPERGRRFAGHERSQQLDALLREDGGAWPEHRSEAALRVWLDAREREHAERVAKLERTSDEVALRVDDETIAFDRLAAGDRWVATADLGEAWITVAVRDRAPATIELERLTT